MVADNPIVVVSLEFRLESARSRSYMDSLRESRLPSVPTSDRFRDLVIVQMKSDTAIIFARFSHSRALTISHRDTIYIYVYGSISLRIALAAMTTRNDRAPSGDPVRHTFHFLILLRVNLILWYEAMTISFDCIATNDKTKLFLRNLYVTETFCPWDASNSYRWSFAKASHMRRPSQMNL